MINCRKELAGCRNKNDSFRAAGRLPVSKLNVVHHWKDDLFFVTNCLMGPTGWLKLRTGGKQT